MGRNARIRKQRKELEQAARRSPPPAQASPASVLILSGLPGSGKTHFADWLQDRGWGRAGRDRPHLYSASLFAAFFLHAVNGDDGPLLTEAARYPGVVIEWGFDPVVELLMLRRLVERGYNAWYFDGDQAAALAGWQEAWKDEPAMTDDIWQAQVNKLNAARPQIEQLYGQKIVETVWQGPDGPEHMPEETIAERLGLGQVAALHKPEDRGSRAGAGSGYAT